MVDIAPTRSECEITFGCEDLKRLGEDLLFSLDLLE